jgi:hypothetical protein
MSLSGRNVSADIPDPIILDADHLSDSITFIADPDMDIFYRLSAAISIDTWLENWDGASMPTYPLPGGGSLGIEGDPLLMTTTVEPVSGPDPGHPGSAAFGLPQPGGTAQAPQRIGDRFVSGTARHENRFIDPIVNRCGWRENFPCPMLITCPWQWNNRPAEGR